MLLRRAFFGWLIPSAFILPLWLFVGIFIFNASGWAFLWLLIAVPSVLVGQLVLTLLVRARGTVRAQRAVSWWDVAGFSVWHLLTISLGFYNPAWWTAAFVGAVVVAIAMFWMELWQLWSEARPSGLVMRTFEGVGYIPPPSASGPGADRAAAAHEVIVVREKPPGA
ncbi:MFS transporter permease [Microbacterium sp. BWT-B31]|uniref:MFS transporter permease n=1 Tax=Microbacterium sp. BWT-B31 TaxID=3232072 RepID=UPI003528ADBF